MDRERFGVIEGVTDKDYYTNSFHVPVWADISAVDKIRLEAPFHKMCNGGHISYIELDNYPEPEDVMKLVRYGYTETNIDYVGINFHIRYCKHCGKPIYDNQRYCPECGAEDIQGVSRVTGYLSLDERFGKGKDAERHDRIKHDGSGESSYASIYEK